MRSGKESSRVRLQPPAETLLPAPHLDAHRTRVKMVLRRLAVEENDVVLPSEPPLTPSSVAIAPHDLVAESTAPRAEHRVQHQLQIVARGRIAVDEQTPGGLQHPLHLRDAQPRVDQIRQQTAAPPHPRQSLA